MAQKSIQLWSGKQSNVGQCAALLLAAICMFMTYADAAAEPRRLNNFVTELLRVEEQKAADAQTFTFDNPRDGWVFFRSISHVEGRQGLLVMLQPQTAPLLWHRPGRPETVEAMRYLPKGEHVLVARGVQGADMPCFNPIRIVFKPTAEAARLEISDWALPTDPGGPIGQELTFSFVEVEPFFMPEK